MKTLTYKIPKFKHFLIIELIPETQTEEIENGLWEFESDLIIKLKLLNAKTTEEKQEIEKLAKTPLKKLADSTFHWGSYIFIDGEEPFYITGNCYIKENIINKLSYKVRTESDFKTEKECNEYIESLPVWNKTKYIDVGNGKDTYYLCETGIKTRPDNLQFYSENDVLNALHSAELKDNKNYSNIWDTIQKHLYNINL